MFKIKKLPIVLIVTLCINSIGFSQVINIEFIKNSSKSTASNLSENLKELGFDYLSKSDEFTMCAEDDFEDIKEYSKSLYFSNDPERGNGEIGIRIYNNKKEDFILFIGYSAYFDNFQTIKDEIKKLFKLEKTFKSSIYNCTVEKYSYNNFFYYIYTDKMVEEYQQPGILISKNSNIECFFFNW